MSSRLVIACGAAASFVLAVIAGTLGNQLAWGAVWAWVAFGVVLVLGGVLTGLLAYRTGRPDGNAGTVRIGKVESGSGPAIGVNPGSVTQIQRQDP